MQPIRLAGLSLFVAASLTQAAVDPTLLGLVMPDAAVVAGVQVEQSQASPFGQYVLSQLQPSSARDRLSSLTGFDPVRDLREIVIGATTTKQALIIGRGVFEPGRITTAALSGGAAVDHYRGIDLLINLGQDGAAAFLDASTIAVGKTADVKAVIDRRVESKTFTGDLARKAGQVSTDNQAWVVSNVPLTSFRPANTTPNSPQTRFLASIQQFSGGVRFGSSNVVFTGQTTMQTDQDAQSMADALRLLASFAQSGNDPNVALLAKAAQFTSEGTVARVTIDLPEADAEKLVSPKARPAQKARQKARASVQ